MMNHSKWLVDNADNLFRQAGLMGKVSGITRLGDTLHIFIDQVKRKKQSRHIQRDEYQVRDTKDTLKLQYPDLKLIRVQYDGSRDPMYSNGFKQFCHRGY